MNRSIMLIGNSNTQFGDQALATAKDWVQALGTEHVAEVAVYMLDGPPNADTYFVVLIATNEDGAIIHQKIGDYVVANQNFVETCDLTDECCLELPEALQQLLHAAPQAATVAA